MGKYTKQVIIYLVKVKKKDSNELKPHTGCVELKTRWDSDHLSDPCQFVFYDDLDDQKIDELKKYIGTTNSIRIYIEGHCCPGSKDIANEDNSIIVTHDILADKLTPILKHNENSVISLISCGAGKDGEDDEMSFAENLHNDLLKNKCNVPVVARTHEVSSNAKNLSKSELGKKRTMDLDIAWEESEKHHHTWERLLHKQPGSKVTYTIDENGNRIKKDSYYHGWKDKVIETCRELKDLTNVKEKKTFLEKWSKDFANLSVEEIYNNMKIELKNSKSILRKHNVLLLSLFSETNTYDTLKALLYDFEIINSSKHTMKEIIKLNEKL